MNEDKNKNVVGIGHNNNQYSKEQYAKLVNSLHKAWHHAKGIMHDVECKFDEAFTKHENGNAHSRKLKDFEIHVKRHEAKVAASRFWNSAKEHIEAIEKKAKADGIELELNKEEESNG